MSAYPNTSALQLVPDIEPEVPSIDPDGAIPWPIVLLEGGQKAGKSYEAARFTGCGQFSRAYWIEVGFEGTARQYKRVPGANYKIVLHDGTIPGILARIAQVHQYALWNNAQGRPPILLVIDSIGAIWNMIQAWVDWMAANSKAAKIKLANDPNAEISATVPVRNKGKALWYRLLGALNDIPAVKVILSRGQEVTKFENNQPTTQKTWSVVGHKELGFDVDIHARLTRSKHAEVVGIRSVEEGGWSETGDDIFLAEKIRRRDFTLEWLVFQRYGLDPANAIVRELHDFNDAQLADPSAVSGDQDEDRREQQRFSEDTIVNAAQLWDDACKATDRAVFTLLWREADAKGWAQVPLINGKGGQTSTLVELLTIEAKRIGELERQQAAGEPEVQPEPVVADGKPEMAELLYQLEVIPDDQLTFLSGLAGRLITKPDEDLQGDARELVMDELRNLAALGVDGAATLIDESMRSGQAIVQRHAAA